MRWIETLESDLGKEAKDDLIAGRGLGVILKEQTIRFRYPVTYPDSVSDTGIAFGDLPARLRFAR